MLEKAIQPLLHQPANFDPGFYEKFLRYISVNWRIKMAFPYCKQAYNCSMAGRIYDMAQQATDGFRLPCLIVHRHVTAWQCRPEFLKTPGYADQANIRD